MKTRNCPSRRPRPMRPRAVHAADPGRHQGRHSPTRRWRLLQAQCSATATAEDIAMLSHRIAASYLAEGLDAAGLSAGRLASPTPALCRNWIGMPALPPIAWATGPTPPRIWKSWRRMAACRAHLRAQAAFWAARAHMQSGDPAQGGDACWPPPPRKSPASTA